MVKMRFSTILFTSQRLHVKEYHKTQKYLSNARQAMEVIEKTPSQKSKSKETWTTPSQQPRCSGWHLACAMDRMPMEVN